MLLGDLLSSLSQLSNRMRVERVEAERFAILGNSLYDRQIVSNDNDMAMDILDAKLTNPDDIVFIL